MCEHAETDYVEPDCGMCVYFDVLVQMRPSAGVVKVIADHMRYEHEPAG